MEAFQVLQNREPRRRVMKVSLDGQNVAAVKRAFAAAAKLLGGTVETRNAEEGSIFVKWSSSPRTRGRRSGGQGSAKTQHSAEAIQREMKRLHGLKGGTGSVDGLPAEAKRKLEISAKRNLSRGVRA